MLRGRLQRHYSLSSSNLLEKVLREHAECRKKIFFLKAIQLAKSDLLT